MFTKMTWLGLQKSQKLQMYQIVQLSTGEHVLAIFPNQYQS